MSCNFGAAVHVFFSLKWSNELKEVQAVVRHMEIEDVEMPNLRLQILLKCTTDIHIYIYSSNFFYMILNSINCLVN
jgi:hypothetical protein